MDKQPNGQSTATEITSIHHPPIDRICAVFAVLMPMTALPQISLLYSTQDASGLSLAMWVLYSIGVIPFLIYGIVYRRLPLIILNILWLIVQLVMIIGILLYK